MLYLAEAILEIIGIDDNVINKYKMRKLFAHIRMASFTEPNLKCSLEQFGGEYYRVVMDRDPVILLRGIEDLMVFLAWLDEDVL